MLKLKAAEYDKKYSTLRYKMQKKLGLEIDKIQ